jgi:hypothetical protein
MERFPGQTLLRGWDFGFNHPACSFRLVDNLGRMNIAYEMMGEKEDLDVFALRVLEQTKSKFPNCSVLYDYGDPRGHDKSPNGKDTCFEVLQSIGINAMGERGIRAYVEPGIRKVRTNLSTLVEGIPKLTIDPSCTIIRAAYFGKYCRNDQGDPHKDGFYEHLADADRYIDHHHGQFSTVKDAMKQIKERQMLKAINQRARYAGY